MLHGIFVGRSRPECLRHSTHFTYGDFESYPGICMHIFKLFSIIAFFFKLRQLLLRAVSRSSSLFLILAHFLTDMELQKLRAWCGIGHYRALLRRSECFKSTSVLFVFLKFSAVLFLLLNLFFVLIKTFNWINIADWNDERQYYPGDIF